MNEIGKYWPSLLRLTVGLFWLYFASQKWNGVDWMKGVIKGTADANPIPGLHQFLDNFQRDLNEVGDAIFATFFARRPDIDPGRRQWQVQAAAAQSQS